MSEPNKCGCCPSITLPIASDDIYYSGQFLTNIKIASGTSLTDTLIAIDNYLGGFTPPSFDKIIGGVAAAVGDGIKRTFSFPHNLGKTPSSVVASPSKEESSNDYTVTFDATKVNIEYSVAPSQNDNLSWNWVAIKNK